MDFEIPRSLATVLLVGHAGIGKRRLASCILSGVTREPPQRGSGSSQDPGRVDPINHPSSTQIKSDTGLRFRTAETLPKEGRINDTSLLRLLKVDSKTLAKGEESPAVDPVARYDLILFMVDMTSQSSWELCQESMMRLEPAWFLGRCAIVVTQVVKVSKYAFDRDDITNFLSDFYNVPTLWTNLEDDAQALLTAHQIVNLLEVNAGYRRPSRRRTLEGFDREPSHDDGIYGPIRPSGPAIGMTGQRSTAIYLMSETPDKFTVAMTLLPSPTSPADNEMSSEH